MDEERKLVLKMLAEGKITPDEAEKLLDALEGSAYEPEMPGPQGLGASAACFGECREPRGADEADTKSGTVGDEDHRLEWEGKARADRGAPFETRFEQAIRDIVEGAVDQAAKAVEAASKLANKVGAKAIEIGDPEGIGGVIGLFGGVPGVRAAVEKSGTFAPSLSNGEIKVDVANGRVSVTGWDGDGYRVEARGRVRGRDFSAEAASEILARCVAVDETTGLIEIDQSNDRRVAGLSVNIHVPRSCRYQRVEIDTSNGSIDVSGLHTERLDLDTSNGSVAVRAVEAREMSVDTSNGSVTVQCKADDVSCDTSHGSITAVVEPLGSEAHVDLDTSFGSIRVVLPDDDDLGVSLKADTSFGKIRAQVSADGTHVMEAKGGSKMYQAATPGFESKPRRCIVKADTSFGSIEVRRGRLEEGTEW